MSKTNRVKCRVCTNEKDGFCLVKQCITRPNKARVCDKFVNDFSKVKIREKVPTVMRPDWYWNQKEARREYREFLKKQEEQKQFNDTLSETASATDSASPDCLAGFRSTAGNTAAPDCLANLRSDTEASDGQ